MVDEYIRSSLLKKFTREELDILLPYVPEAWLKG